ncbi:MAG: metal ABC transporter ATP-binding protein [Candidatus Moranbacteria bacterium]|nr:metal ABC transporter ATP-binding protein [Candidatus Moranbacteria bacterium]
MSAHANLITISHLSFQYRAGQPILADISLSIEAGDYVGIIGPNGSGKSTFLKLLLGLISLQGGSVELFGQPIALFRDWQKIGYVSQTGFQGEKNFPATVAEVIASGQPVKSFFPDKAERQTLRYKIETAADKVGIRHLLARRIGELSGGEEQRVFIAQALVSDPLLLVLDEPTAGIDVSTETSFYQLLHDLNTVHGKTILLVSHNLEALAHNAKTAVCINRTILYQGPALGLHEPRVVETVFGARAWHTAVDVDHIL